MVDSTIINLVIRGPQIGAVMLFQGLNAGNHLRKKSDPKGTPFGAFSVR